MGISDLKLEISDRGDLGFEIGDLPGAVSPTRLRRGGGSPHGAGRGAGVYWVP
jgi:hypothetical protein